MSELMIKPIEVDKLRNKIIEKVSKLNLTFIELLYKMIIASRTLEK